MKNAVVPRLSAARKAVLLATGGMVVALPLAIGIVNLPDVEAQVKTPVPKFGVASLSGLAVLLPPVQHLGPRSIWVLSRALCSAST